MCLCVQTAGRIDKWAKSTCQTTTTNFLQFSERQHAPFTSRSISAPQSENLRFMQNREKGGLHVHNSAQCRSLNCQKCEVTLCCPYAINGLISDINLATETHFCTSDESFPSEDRNRGCQFKPQQVPVCWLRLTRAGGYQLSPSHSKLQQLRVFAGTWQTACIYLRDKRDLHEGMLNLSDQLALHHYATHNPPRYTGYASMHFY